MPRKDLEALKSRLVHPRTTIDDTFEDVVCGHHSSAVTLAAVMLAAPASPTIQSPRAYVPVVISSSPAKKSRHRDYPPNMLELPFDGLVKRLLLHSNNSICFPSNGTARCLLISHDHHPEGHSSLDHFGSVATHAKLRAWPLK